MKLEESAPAKLNLALQVLGRGEDGYHQIRSVMIGLDLADSLRLEAVPGAAPGVEIALEPPVDGVPADDRNLVVRAARAYREAFGGSNGRLRFTLRKRVPSEAGLGGGSSDAAAALRMLARRGGQAPDSEGMLAVAAAVGSDVPFAVRGGAALVEGRGERLRALAAPHRLWVVLVRPDLAVSTAWCYRRWDEMHLDDRGGVRRGDSLPTDPDARLEALRRALAAGDAAGVARAAFNDLESPVLAEHPHLRALLEALEQGGCLGARMTGSGSCFFGIAPTRDAARKAAREVRRRSLGRVWLTRTRISPPPGGRSGAGG